MEEKKKEISQKIVPQLIEEEMKTSYLDYSMSVIVGRALPDARDGLKPVHRRILYAMNEMGMFHNKPFKKCARIVGEVLGKFHPHGDTAVYDALVRMVQDFSLRYTLIKGQGNFGSVDGDSAAAMRYTEAKLNKKAGEMLQDIDKKTVKFVNNFDGSLIEPSVLPSKFPNLLVNGSSGIAVGMATNIPPHNLGEIIDGTIALIDNPGLDVLELMKYIRGPDFPTAGIIYGKNGIKNAYSKGRGKIILRAKTSIEEIKGKKRIIVNEIPYMVNKSLMLEQMASLVRNKKIEGIKFIRDESDRKGMRIVIGLKQDYNPELVLNQLFAHTRLQVSFGIIMLALVNNEPKVLNLKQLIKCYIDHRRTVVRKRTEFDLNKASERAHVLEGIIIALDDIDNVIVKIKKSRTVEEAASVLLRDYTLTDVQAKAILDMRLQRLASLEQEKIKKEHRDLLKLIEELKAILADEKKILKIIKDELIELKEKYSDERRTKIADMDASELEINEEDLIKEEDMVVTITHRGYVKRLGINSYRTQARGGKGVIVATTKEGDFVENLFIASTHDYLLFFTNLGKVKWLKVYEIPETSRQSKGKAVVNLLKLSEGEKITAFIPVRKFNGYLIMITKRGVVKKTSLELFSKPRKGGIAAISLDEGDELINVERTMGEEQIIIATRNGKAIRFSERNLRAMGRTARGVRGIRLKENDYVIGSVIANDEDTLFTITENGYGKRSKVSDYRLIGRGGSGVKNIICSERNGKVVDINSLTDKDDIMVMSKGGVAIRMSAKNISVIGRATQGVRIMRLGEGDKIVAAAKIVEE